MTKIVEIGSHRDIAYIIISNDKKISGYISVEDEDENVNWEKYKFNIPGMKITYNKRGHSIFDPNGKYVWIGFSTELESTLFKSLKTVNQYINNLIDKYTKYRGNKETD